MKLTPEIIIYEGGEARVEVRLDRETVWLTQEQMSVLFGRERSVGQIPTRHALPPVGDARAARPSDHRLHSERAPAGCARSDRGATGHRPAVAHAHHSHAGQRRRAGCARRGATLPPFLAAAAGV